MDISDEASDEASEDSEDSSIGVVRSFWPKVSPRPQRVRHCGSYEKKVVEAVALAFMSSARYSLKGDVGMESTATPIILVSVSNLLKNWRNTAFSVHEGLTPWCTQPAGTTPDWSTPMISEDTVPLGMTCCKSITPDRTRFNSSTVRWRCMERTAHGANTMRPSR